MLPSSFCLLVLLQLATGSAQWNFYPSANRRQQQPQYPRQQHQLQQHQQQQSPRQNWRSPPQGYSQYYSSRPSFSAITPTQSQQHGSYQTFNGRYQGTQQQTPFQRPVSYSSNFNSKPVFTPIRAPHNIAQDSFARPATSQSYSIVTGSSSSTQPSNPVLRETAEQPSKVSSSPPRNEISVPPPTPSEQPSSRNVIQVPPTPSEHPLGKRNRTYEEEILPPAGRAPEDPAMQEEYEQFLKWMRSNRVQSSKTAPKTSASPLETTSPDTTTAVIPDTTTVTVPADATVPAEKAVLLPLENDTAPLETKASNEEDFVKVTTAIVTTPDVISVPSIEAKTAPEPNLKSEPEESKGKSGDSVTDDVSDDDDDHVDDDRESDTLTPTTTDNQSSSEATEPSTTIDSQITSTLPTTTTSEAETTAILIPITTGAADPTTHDFSAKNNLTSNSTFANQTSPTQAVITLNSTTSPAEARNATLKDSEITFIKADSNATATSSRTVKRIQSGFGDRQSNRIRFIPKTNLLLTPPTPSSASADFSTVTLLETNVAGTNSTTKSPVYFFLNRRKQLYRKHLNKFNSGSMTNLINGNATAASTTTPAPSTTTVSASTSRPRLRYTKASTTVQPTSVITLLTTPTVEPTTSLTSTRSPWKTRANLTKAFKPVITVMSSTESSKLGPDEEIGNPDGSRRKSNSRVLRPKKPIYIQYVNQPVSKSSSMAAAKSKPFTISIERANESSETNNTSDQNGMQLKQGNSSDLTNIRDLNRDQGKNTSAFDSFDVIAVQKTFHDSSGLALATKKFKPYPAINKPPFELQGYARRPDLVTAVTSRVAYNGVRYKNVMPSGLVRATSPPSSSSTGSKTTVASTPIMKQDGATTITKVATTTSNSAAFITTTVSTSTTSTTTASTTTTSTTTTHSTTTTSTTTTPSTTTSSTTTTSTASTTTAIIATLNSSARNAENLVFATSPSEINLLDDELSVKAKVTEIHPWDSKVTLRASADANPTLTPTTTPASGNFNANFFDRYYLKGWDSTDVKSEARGGKVADFSSINETLGIKINEQLLSGRRGGSASMDIPDFLRFAVPMKMPAQESLEKKMDAVQDGYARYIRH